MKALMAMLLTGFAFLATEGSAFAQRGGRGWNGNRAWNWYSGGNYGGGLYNGAYGNPGYGTYSNPWGNSRYGYGTPYAFGNVTPFYGGQYYYGPIDSYSPPATTYYQPQTTTTSFYQPAADPNAVNMEVVLPENATLWIQDQQMSESGAVRRFVSPALETGKSFTYNLRAKWTDASGQSVERTKKVDVKAGSWIGVDFNKADNK